LSKVVQMGITTLAYVAFGFFGMNFLGFVLGDIFGLLVTAVLLIYKGKGQKNWMWLWPGWSAVKEQAVRYRRFPLFSMQANLINMLSNQAPVLLMTKFFGPAVVGFFNLSQKVLGAPLAVFSKAVSDVFRERASREYREKGNCRPTYLRTMKSLTAIGFLPFLLLFFLAPSLFSFLFGSSWVKAGEYTRILAMMYFFRFIASPLSFMFYIAEKQSLDLLWQIALFVVTVSSILVGYWQRSPEISLWCFSIAYSVMYLIYLKFSSKLAQGTSRGQ